MSVCRRRRARPTQPAVTIRTRSPSRRLSSSSASDASSQQFRQCPGRAYTNTVHRVDRRAFDVPALGVEDRGVDRRAERHALAAVLVAGRSSRRLSVLQRPYSPSR